MQRQLASRTLGKLLEFLGSFLLIHLFMGPRTNGESRPGILIRHMFSSWLGARGCELGCSSLFPGAFEEGY